jgi:hypothetical protein
MLEKAIRYAARSGRTILDDDLGAGIDSIVVLIGSDVHPVGHPRSLEVYMLDPTPSNFRFR